MLSVNGLQMHMDKGTDKVVPTTEMAVTTHVEEVNLTTTCRVCLVKQVPANLYCLFGQNKIFQDLSIASAIYECFGVELKEDDDLPKYVCMKCASDTLHSYTFKKCLNKCQGYLEKQRKSAIITNDEILHSQNEEIGMHNFQDVFHNHLIQETSTNFANQEVSNIISDVVTIVKEEKDLVLSDEENYNTESSILYVLADHTYSKGIFAEIDRTDENVENNFVDLIKTNVIKSVSNSIKDAKINVKRSYGRRKNKLQHTKIRNNTSKSSKWWYKEAGPPYECTICGRRYGVRYRAFYMHVRTHLVYKQSCTYCGKKFSRDKMAIHIRIHTKVQSYICDQCPARFTVAGHLTRHMRCHTGAKLYVCEICGKAFTQSTTLNIHKNVHVNNTRYICLCGKTFLSSDSYRKHLYTHYDNGKLVEAPKENAKEELGNSENKFTCSTCGKVCRKSSALHIHSRVHLEDTSYHCSLCSETFYSQLNYQVHLFWHELLQKEDGSTSQSSYWLCEFCSEVFNEKDVLVSHVLTHVEKSFECNTCHRTYCTRKALLQHARKHSKERRFKCTECNKAFLYAATLQQHMRIHTGEKPYKCEVCLRSFVQQQHLMNHMLTHTGEKKYICPYCNKAFALNGNLTVHKRIHTGETPYVCVDCGKGFCDSSNLKRHRQIRRSEKHCGVAER